MLKFKLIGLSPFTLNDMGNPFHRPHPNIVMSPEVLELTIIHVFQSNGVMNSLITLSTVLNLNYEYRL